MKAINLTRRKQLASEVSVKKTLFGAMMGLRFYPKLRDGEAMYFPFKNDSPITVDMFFVFYPIDVLFLDKHGVVVGMKKNFLPFTAMWKSVNCRSFLEINKGTIDATGTKIGDKIKII